MNTVSSSINIFCPIQKAFEYTSIPQNGPKFISFLKENSHISPEKTGLGQSFHWQYFMGGVEMSGEAKLAEYVPLKNSFLLQPDRLYRHGLSCSNRQKKE